jgi:hypothetical protein
VETILWQTSASRAIDRVNPAKSGARVCHQPIRGVLPMSQLNYIYENERGITCFDRYFEYLGDIKSKMPDTLAAFATDQSRYELCGEHTLHDAWLKSFAVDKRYLDKNSPTSDVQICLLLATHRTVITLQYSGVLDLTCSLGADRWPNQPVDLLVHEVRVISDDVFSHVFCFDRSVWIEVRFAQFEVVESRV